MEHENLSKIIEDIYNCPFNGLITKKEDAPVIVSVLKTLKDSKEPIPIQSALAILEDSKKILLQITNV